MLGDTLLKGLVSIRQYVADAKAPYKHLVDGVEFIKVIPKNPRGKLLRRF